jgi:hypothetical protein
MVDCPECKWSYPSTTYVSPLVLNGVFTQSICGICALEVSNRLHGIPRTYFTGEMAEEMRQRAIRWRESNPKFGPKDSSASPTKS